MIYGFSPGHITAIFSIRDISENILEKGSVGTGFSITEGVLTEAEISPSKKQVVNIFINDELADAPVSKSVLLYYFNLTKEPVSITLKHWLKLPIGAGFGCSASGALSASYILNEKLGLDLSKTECAQIAHMAEVKNKTGLGDVIGSFYGGFEIRLKQGAPGIGKIRSVRLSHDIRAVCASGGILETKKVLTDINLRKKIIDTGERIMKPIFDNKNITVSEIIQLAKEFSFKIGLMTKEMQNALKTLQESGFGDSSMIMLGKSIFCLTERQNVDEVQNILKKILPKWLIFNTDIDYEGARIIEYSD